MSDPDDPRPLPRRTTPARTLRLFIGASPPAALKNRIAEIIDRLRPEAGSAIRFSRPENMHLTLRFLGATPAEEPPRLQALLDAVAHRQAPLRLRPSLWGGFPNLARPRVLWLGFDGDVEALNELAHAVGYDEPRPFAPHLTIARIGARRSHIGARPPDSPRHADDPSRSGESPPANAHPDAAALVETLVDRLRAIDPPDASWPLTTLQLFESRLTPQGARYGVRHNVDLTGAAGATS